MAMTEEARRARIDEAVAAYDQAAGENVRLPWRGGSEVFPVVSVELDSVVLNPRSHRIRAQLESHESSELIERDPWSDEAQAAIAEILKEIGDNFEELRENLAEDTQLQPGVITRTGLLVNANRRAVALRENGETYVKVAVLPADTTTAEIDDLELRLQMQRDFREDYTYTNRLLFVDEMIGRQNRPVEQVVRALNLAASSDARSMNRGRAQVERDTRVLAMIRGVQERSEGKIPLTDFDEQEIALEELDRARAELEGQDAADAERLAEIRLLGLLTNVPYRDLRLLDGKAVDEHVTPMLDDEPRFAAITPSPAEAGDDEPEGLEVLGEENGDAQASSNRISTLVDVLAKSRGEEEVRLPTAEGEVAESREAIADELQEILRAAATEARNASRHEDRLTAPLGRLDEARRKLRAAEEAWEAVTGEDGFDGAGFGQRLRELRDQAESLVSRVESSDG